MDNEKLTDSLVRLTADVAEIKQKLNNDYTQIQTVSHSVASHETRLVKLETSRESSVKTLATVATAILNLATLTIALLALLAK